MRHRYSNRYRVGALREALVFAAGLAVVACLDPSGVGGWTICPFHHLGDLLGIQFCPGCGLGRSVGFLARGDIAASLAMHPLGIPAVSLLVVHIARLLRTHYARPTDRGGLPPLAISLR